VRSIMTIRCAILFVAALVLAACASGSPAEDASPTASAQGATGNVECPSVDLQGPEGEAPDLSGTWFGIGQRGASPRPGTYEFNVLNSCVAFVGRSTEEGEEVGESWMNTFIGHMTPDLTISGQWSIVSTGGGYCGSGATGAECTRARGTLVLDMDFIPTADGERMRLVLLDVTRIPDQSSGLGVFVTGIWVRPGDEALFDVPVE
jgi:hypothetical protein